MQATSKCHQPIGSVLNYGISVPEKLKTRLTRHDLNRPARDEYVGIRGIQKSAGRGAFRLHPTRWGFLKLLDD